MEFELKEVIEMCKMGDCKAKEELLERVKPLILRTAYSIYLDTPKEDMVQQGYLIALESVKTFDIKKGIPYISYLKSALYYGIYKKSKTPQESYLNEPVGEGMEAIDFIEDDSLSALEEFIKNEEYEELRKAIDALPEKQKKVVYENYIKGRSLKDIAHDMGIKYISAAKLKDRGIKNLREILQSSYKCGA